MAFRVIYKGLEVICDTFADLDFLAEQAINYKPAARTESARVPTQQEKAPALPLRDGNDKDARLIAFIEALPEKTIEVLSVLVANGAMTDAGLRAALKLDNNMQLAGRVAPISRNAKKIGLKAQDVLLTKVINNKPGERKYEYQAAQYAHRFIRQRTERGG